MGPTSVAVVASPLATLVCEKVVPGTRNWGSADAPTKRTLQSVLRVQPLLLVR